MNNFKYIIFKDKLHEQLNSYQKLFKVYFPLKSNNSNELIKLLDIFQSNFEVETIEYANMLVNEYGIDAQRILFCPVYDAITQIDAAVRLGIRFFVVTSPIESKTLKNYSQPTHYIIRVRSDQIVPNATAFRPFGAQIKDVDEIIANFRDGFYGFSFYISQETRQLLSANTTISEFFEELYTKYTYRTINIGGGFSLDDSKDLQQKLNAFFEGDLLIEPGRHLLDPCVNIEVTIIQKTQNAGNTYLTLNVGIYNGLIDIIIKNKRFDIASPEAKGDLTKYIVLGPTADTADRLGEYCLPNDLQVGDRLIIHDCGAYCKVLSTDFCGYNNFDVVIK